MLTEKMIRVNNKLTQTTHRAFKIWCLEHGKTLQDGLEFAVKQCMKRELGGAAALGMVEVSPGVWRYPPDAAAAPRANPLKIEPADIPKIIKETAEFALSKQDGVPAPKPAAEILYSVNGEPLTITDNDGKWAMGDNDCRMYKRTPAGYVMDPPWEDETPQQEEPAFDPQAHYDEVLKKLNPRSALDDTRRAIEYHFLDSTYPNWEPGTSAVTNGHATGGTGPITAKEYDVPPTWVDNAGHTRAQNLARFGEDEAIEYWPPPPPRPGEDRV